MKNIFSLVAVCFVILLVSVSLPTKAVAEDVIEIKVGTVHPAKHRLTTDAFEVYAKEIEKKTHGRVKFKWFLAGSLVQWGNAKKGLKSGLIDMALVVPVWVTENEFPVTRMLQLPFIVDSASHGALTYYRAFQEMPQMQDEYRDLKPLGFFSTPDLNIHTKGPAPKTLADLQGLKLWGSSNMVMEMIKLLGASPRHTKIQDVYMAIQRGMTDGLFFPEAPMRSFKLVELIRNHTVSSLGVGVEFYAMNLKKWNSLPKDIQKVFEDMTLSASCQAGATLAKENDWVIDELKARGDDFYYLPEEEKRIWKTKVQPLADSYIEALNKKGMDGQAIYDKIVECAEWARQNPYQPDNWWGRTGRK
jgi:TRAP-type transport system periplasmic protein